MTVELFELLAKRPVVNFMGEVFERFGHFQLAALAPLVVARHSVIPSALDVQRRQILRDQVRRTEQILRQVGIQQLIGLLNLKNSKN